MKEGIIHALNALGERIKQMESDIYFKDLEIERLKKVLEEAETEMATTGGDESK